MINIEEFEQVFKSISKNHYPSHLHNQIESAQKELAGELFFNLLLKQTKIEAGHLYPPKNAKEFRELHKRIAGANCQLHLKQSLLYYLLKDCSLVAKDKEEKAANEFQEQCCLPKKYWVIMQGFWDLDKLNYRRAVLYLTQPSLLPVLSSEVLGTLLKADEFALAIAYYHAVQPTLDSQDLREEFFHAICKASLTEAFFFLRRQPPSEQKHLLQLLIDSVLSLPASEERKRKGLELIELPLNVDEEVWFKEYLTTGKGRKYDRAGDTVLTRLLARGEYDLMLDSIDDVNPSNGKVDGFRWDNIVAGINRGVGDRRGLNSFATST